MTVTIILTLIKCALLFLHDVGGNLFYPWERLLEFFPKDIEEKAKQHKPPFPTAPAIGWIIAALCMLGFIGVIVYGGWDGVQRGYTFGQFLVWFLVILFGVKAFDIIVLDYILITKTRFSSITFRRPKAEPVITTLALTGRNRSGSALCCRLPRF